MIGNDNFLKKFFPKSVRNYTVTTIDLDITDLSIADILRNTNRAIPQNSRLRNALSGGLHAIVIQCKSTLLEPLSGLLLIITGEDVELNIYSREYMILNINEEMISTESDIQETMEYITRHLILNYRDILYSFHNFYAKFVFEDYEGIEDVASVAELIRDMYEQYQRELNPKSKS